MQDSDIYRELYTIKTSDFGSKIRRAMTLAAYKLSTGLDIDSSLIMPLNRLPYGDDVISTFLSLSLTLRASFETAAADAPILRLFNEYNSDCTGVNIKWAIHDILKELNKGATSSEYETINALGGSVVVIAGNNNSMFMFAEHSSETEYGIEIAPPETGFPTDYFKVTVTNLQTGYSMEESVLVSGADMFTPAYVFTNYDILTVMMDPGIVEIKVTNYDTGEVLSTCTISTDVCRFGNSEPERFIPTSARHYIYHDDGTDSTIDKYIGDHSRIMTPETLNGHPVKIIGHSSFMNTSVTGVKILDGVTTIE